MALLGLLGLPSGHARLGGRADGLLALQRLWAGAHAAVQLAASVGQGFGLARGTGAAGVGVALPI